MPESRFVYENNKGKFVVRNTEFNEIYGTFKSLEVALIFVDICVRLGWDKSVLKKERIKLIIKYESPNRYITETCGKFNVVKSSVNGRCLSYGRFDSLSDAREHRDFCVENDWDVSCRRISFTRSRNLVNERYISKSGDKFLVSKNFGDVLERFDLCSTLEEAIECRDFWVSVDWSWDCVDLS